jgi:hypothetical protein
LHQEHDEGLEYCHFCHKRYEQPALRECKEQTLRLSSISPISHLLYVRRLRQLLTPIHGFHPFRKITRRHGLSTRTGRSVRSVSAPGYNQYTLRRNERSPSIPSQTSTFSIARIVIRNCFLRSVVHAVRCGIVLLGSIGNRWLSGLLIPRSTSIASRSDIWMQGQQRILSPDHWCAEWTATNSSTFHEHHAMAANSQCRHGNSSEYSATLPPPTHFCPLLSSQHSLFGFISSVSRLHLLHLTMIPSLPLLGVVRQLRATRCAHGRPCQSTTSQSWSGDCCESESGGT